MTIAYDAVSNASYTGDLTGATWVHTPVGTPRGVIWFTMQNTSADQIVGVTYGGVTMSEVTGSPLLGTAGTAFQSVYCYYLGASIPTGAQNVEVDTSSTAAKRGVCITVTAAGDTQVDASQTLDSLTANPSLSVATTAATNTFIAAAIASGSAGVVDLTNGANYTQVYENDAGAWIAQSQYKTANGAGGNITVDWTAVIEEAFAIAVAVKESAGGGGTVITDPFGMSGFFGG